MRNKKLQNFRGFSSMLSLVVGAVLISSISYMGVRTYQDSHAASGGSIYVNPGSDTLTAGSTVSISVRENSGTEAVNSVQFSLNYDSNKLQYSSIVDGSAFPVIAATNATTGNIKVGRANADNTVTGDQAIVTINFKVIGTSGTAALTLDKQYSLLVRSSDNQDMLQSIGNGSYTITGSTTPSPQPTPSPTPTPSPPSANGQPVLYISPASGTYPKDSTISAAVRLNSYNTAVNTVEAVVGYPADKLQYVSATEGGSYTTVQRTKNSNGSIDIIRGVPGGSSGKTGDNLVVTLNFKVTGSSGSANLSINNGSAAYDSSASGSNVLNLASSAGADYALAPTGSVPTPPPAAPSPSAPQNKVITSLSQSVKIGVGQNGQAIISTVDGTSLTELNGQVSLTPTTVSTGGSIKKVEYWLDKKLISTQTSVPFTYAFDTTKLRNGTYAMTVKTFYNSGTVDIKTDKMLVKNKVTLAYVFRQYAPSALALIAILAVCVVFVWKLVIPRFAFAHKTPAYLVKDHDIVHGAGNPQSASKLVMDDPVVIAPTPAPSEPDDLEYDATGSIDTGEVQKPEEPGVIKPTNDQTPKP
jgi:hypothetical protein